MRKLVMIGVTLAGLGVSGHARAQTPLTPAQMTLFANSIFPDNAAGLITPATMRSFSAVQNTSFLFLTQLGTNVYTILQNAANATGGVCSVGTSGAACGLLNGSNTYSAAQHWTAATNTIGSSNVSWLESLLPGSTTTTPLVVTSNPAIGATNWTAGLFAVQGADWSAANQNIIPHVGVAYANGTNPYRYWGGYDVVYIPSGSAYKSAFGSELTIASQIDAPAVTPYTIAGLPSQYTSGLHMSCGAGSPWNGKCSDVMSVVGNSGLYLSGIVFAPGALDVTSGTAPAIALPANYEIATYGTNGKTWRIFSNDITGTTLGQIILGDGVFDLYLGATHELALTANNIQLNNRVVFNFNDSGSYPSASSINGGAVLWNFTNSSAEVDFFNSSFSSTDSFRFYQQTAASAATLLVDITTSAMVLSIPPKFASSTTGASTETFTNSPCSVAPTAPQWVPVQVTGLTGTYYISVCH